MSEKTKAKLDAFLSRWTSRKLMVFLIAVAALFLDKINSEEWVNVAMMYIGAEAAIDAIIRLRSKS